MRELEPELATDEYNGTELSLWDEIKNLAHSDPLYPRRERLANEI